MSCNVFTSGIIELARDPESTGTNAQAVRDHLESCAACRARLDGERELTAGLRALARSISTPRMDVDREMALLAAFAAGTSATGAGVPAGRVRRAWRSESGRLTRRVWWPWAAAATVALATAVAWVAGPGDQPANSSPAAASTQPGPPPRVAPRPDSAIAAVPHVVAGAPTAATGPGTRAAGRGAARWTAPAPPPVRLSEFTPLPSAVGLPELESGRILRVEIPAAMLPAYGLEVVPDAVTAPIPLDMLVGQDGQPRAVRLAGRDE